MNLTELATSILDSKVNAEDVDNQVRTTRHVALPENT